MELMQAIDAALKGRRVRVEWVKGHAGHPLNEAADRRANAAATAVRGGGVPHEGPGLGGHPPPGARAAGEGTGPGGGPRGGPPSGPGGGAPGGGGAAAGAQAAVDASSSPDPYRCRRT
ncbi:RNase H family protein [Corynebacterium neomassiliense]|uniref:RNase H family protein n=1 Tax=Corynebacterium neomassiliense TaxID=2079482 RepID=UPI002351BAA2|nr:RNase H family protein [Corynebacterium neomassiliense]